MLATMKPVMAGPDQHAAYMLRGILEMALAAKIKLAPPVRDWLMRAT